MPISDEWADEAWELIKSLQEENIKLLNLLIGSGVSFVPSSSAVALEASDEEKAELEFIGRDPWFRKQKSLERAFRRPKLSEDSNEP
jgi:hypothetical protein